MGAWSFIGDAKDVTNLEEAVKAQADTTNMSFHAGSPMLGSDIRLEGFGEAMEQSHTPEEEEAMLLEAVNAAKEAEVVVLAIGEDRLQSGEATSNANIRIPEIQQRLLERVSEVNRKTLSLFSSTAVRSTCAMSYRKQKPFLKYGCRVPRVPMQSQMLFLVHTLQAAS